MKKLPALLVVILSSTTLHAQGVWTEVNLNPFTDLRTGTIDVVTPTRLAPTSQPGAARPSECQDAPGPSRAFDGHGMGRGRRPTLSAGHLSVDFERA